MTNKMILMGLGLSVALLSGCGSDNDTTETTGTTDPVATETTGTTDPVATASVFTYDLLVGKTYTVIYAEDGAQENITFRETEIYFVDPSGESGTVPYTIDANGALIVTGDEVYTYTLTNIEEGGNLNVHGDSDGELVWVLQS